MKQKTLTKLTSVLLSVLLLLSCCGTAWGAEATAEDTVQEAQTFTVPILRDKTAASDSIALMGEDEESDGPVIAGAYTHDFFVTSTSFNIHVEIYNMKDVRQKLTLSVVDEAGNTVATQEDVAYAESSGLDYRMRLVKAVDTYTGYSVKFDYTGKYKLNNELESVFITPINDVAIRDIKILDRATASLQVLLANVKSGDKYTLFYRRDEDYTEIRQDVVVGEDGLIRVSFDCSFNRYDFLYVCEEGAEYSWDKLDYTSLYRFEAIDDYDIYPNEGLWADDYLDASDSNSWVTLGHKAYAEEPYEESDLKNVSVTMMDLTEGKTVGTMGEKLFDDHYREINAEIEINQTLDPTHRYAVVANDGYSLRISPDIIVTDKPTLIGMNTYNADNKYVSQLPAGNTSFIVYVGSCSLKDRENIKVELLEGSSNTVMATSAYNKDLGRYVMTPSGAIPAGEHTLKATYQNLTYTKSVTFVASSSAATTYRQSVNDTYEYQGKVYIQAMIDKTYDPKDCTYQVVFEGESYPATYHRTLTQSNSSNYNYFVVTLDSESLVGVNWSNPACLEIYHDGTLIQPVYADNMEIGYTEYYDSSFVYNPYDETSSTITYYAEGLASGASYTMCAYDALTEKNISIKATKATTGSITFNKSDLAKIHTYCTLGSYYFNTLIHLEQNNEYLFSRWIDSLGTPLLKPEFGFQSTFADCRYVILNLPYQDYAYYKLADSEEGLASATYQKMDVGVLYTLKDQQGLQKIHAQFKTSDGKESAAQLAGIYLDNKAPAFEILQQLPSVLNINAEDQITFSLRVSTDEDCVIRYHFYDKDGNQIGYNYNYRIGTGTSTITAYAGVDQEPMEKATRIDFYAEDEAGNKTAVQSFPITVVRQYANYMVGDTTLRINTASGIIESAENVGATLTIPQKLGNITVTGIGDRVFYNCDSLTRISLPNTVTGIGESAFAWCSNLETITTGNGLVSIGKEAFYQCESLKSIKLPESMSGIGTAAFKECTSLASINIPKGVLSIPSECFLECESLASITISEGVTTIGSSAFYGCSSLPSLEIPSTVYSIGEDAFCRCSNMSTITILNPRCTIYRDLWTFPMTTTICGYSNSTAYEFAYLYDRTFVPMEGVFGSVSYSGNTVTCENVYPSSPDKGGQIMAGLYNKKGLLLDIVFLDDDNYLTLTAPDDVTITDTYVKLFWWDMTETAPISASTKINVD